MTDLFIQKNLFIAGDVRGFNRFISPFHNREIVFALFDIFDHAFVNRFLFNVGQPGKSVENYDRHRDINGVGKVCRLKKGDHKNSLWDMILEYKQSTFRLSSFGSENSFHLKAEVLGDADPGLLPFIYSGPLWGKPADSSIDFRLSGPGLKGISIIETPFCSDQEIINLISAYISGPEKDKKNLNKNKTSIFIFSNLIRLNFFKLPSKPGEMSFDHSGNEKNTRFDRVPVFTDSREFDSALEAALYETENYTEDSDFVMKALKILVSGNTVIDPGDNTMYTLLNRSWVQMLTNVFGLEDKWGQGPFISNWAGGFSALISSLFSLDLAKHNILRIINTQQASGKIPEFQLKGKDSTRSCMPVLLLCVWKIYQKSGDIRLLEAVFEPLLKWMDWFDNNRRDRYGLYTWGSDNPDSLDEFGVSTGFIDASWESGMEDSPMWNEVSWDPKVNTFSASCVGLSSLIAFNYRVLSKMASLLGYSDKKETLNKKYLDISSRIDELLFDSRTNTYKNRRHDGAFVRTISPTSFFPMLASIPDTKRGENIIRFGLFNNDFCWGNFPLSSVAKAFWGYDPDGSGWRGRIWPPFNYLVYQGLKNYSSWHASRLAAASASIFIREYKSHGHIHENYSALTGWGISRDGVYFRSCPFFTWGGLMGLMLIEEIVDIDFKGCLRFGSPFFDSPMGVDRITLKNDIWSVHTWKEGTRASLKGTKFFESNPGTGVRNFTMSKDRIHFDLIGIDNTMISFCPKALGYDKKIARVYESDIFIGKFLIDQERGINFELSLEPRVLRSIKIKLIG